MQVLMKFIAPSKVARQEGAINFKSSKVICQTDFSLCVLMELLLANKK